MKILVTGYWMLDGMIIDVISGELINYMIGHELS